MIFGAAATVMQTFWMAAMEAAKFLATKALMLSIIAIVLPWAIKPVIIWAFEYIVKYGRDILSFFQSEVGQVVASSGMDLSYQLTGVGGFLAIQTGLIDYASIIFSGWGLYWAVAILAKTPKVL